MKWIGSETNEKIVSYREVLTQYSNQKVSSWCHQEVYNILIELAKILEEYPNFHKCGNALNKLAYYFYPGNQAWEEEECIYALTLCDDLINLLVSLVDMLINGKIHMTTMRVLERKIITLVNVLSDIPRCEIESHCKKTTLCPKLRLGLC